MLNQTIRDHQSFSSVYNTFAVCTQKYFNRYVARVPVEFAPSDNLAVGKAVDVALQHAHEAKAFDDAMKENFITFESDKWYAYALGVWSARKELFARIFGDDTDVLLQAPFSFPIVDRETGEIVQTVTGYMDGLAYDGAIYEVKTVTKSDDATINGYIHGGQTELYCHAVNLVNGRIPAVKYRFVVKPMIRQKKDETEEAFHERMQAAGRDVASAVIDRDVEYTKAQIAEVVDDMTDIIVTNLDAKPWKNRRACFQYGSVCEYYNVCWKNPAVQIDNESEVNQ